MCHPYRKTDWFANGDGIGNIGCFYYSQSFTGDCISGCIIFPDVHQFAFKIVIIIRLNTSGTVLKLPFPYLVPITPEPADIFHHCVIIIRSDRSVFFAIYIVCVNDIVFRIQRLTFTMPLPADIRY